MSTNREACRLRDITVEGQLIRTGEFPFQPENDKELISASSTLFDKADRDEACKKLGRILSFTQIASLRLKSLDDHFRHDIRPTFRILSSAGKYIGRIWLPKLSLKYTFNKDGNLEKKEFNFIALSSCNEYRQAEEVLNSVGLEYSRDRAVLNVMLIWYAKDSNVARRLGIGHVFQDEWFKERLALKTIILE